MKPSWQQFPWKSTCENRGRQSRDFSTYNESDTYTSIWASSNASKVFSHVGWNMGKPKVFTMKGQIALSRTRKVKNLSRQRNTSYENIPYNGNNWNNEYNYNDSLSGLPEGRSWLCDPEFASRCKDVYRRAVLVMGFRVTIDTTQIGDESVYIAVIFVCQRQWLVFVDAGSIASVLCFDWVRGSDHIFPQDICRNRNINSYKLCNKYKWYNEYKLTCPWNSLLRGRQSSPDAFWQRRMEIRRAGSNPYRP